MHVQSVTKFFVIHYKESIFREKSKFLMIIFEEVKSTPKSSSIFYVLNTIFPTNIFLQQDHKALNDEHFRENLKFCSISQDHV